LGLFAGEAGLLGPCSLCSDTVRDGIQFGLPWASGSHATFFCSPWF
jgi:hypothetical protein